MSQKTVNGSPDNVDQRNILHYQLKGARVCMSGTEVFSVEIFLLYVISEAPSGDMVC